MRSPAKAIVELQLYANLLSEIKKRTRTGQQNASLAVNQELIAMYWDIGKMIHDRQEKEGWGTVQRIVTLRSATPNERRHRRADSAWFGPGDLYYN